MRVGMFIPRETEAARLWREEEPCHAWSPRTPPPSRPRWAARSSRRQPGARHWPVVPAPPQGPLGSARFRGPAPSQGHVPARPGAAAAGTCWGWARHRHWAASRRTGTQESGSAGGPSCCAVTFPCPFGHCIERPGRRFSSSPQASRAGPEPGRGGPRALTLYGSGGRRQLRAVHGLDAARRWSLVNRAGPGHTAAPYVGRACRCRSNRRLGTGRGVHAPPTGPLSSQRARAPDTAAAHAHRPLPARRANDPTPVRRGAAPLASVAGSARGPVRRYTAVGCERPQRRGPLGVQAVPARSRAPPTYPPGSARPPPTAGSPARRLVISHRAWSQVSTGAPAVAWPQAWSTSAAVRLGHRAWSPLWLRWVTGPGQPGPWVCRVARPAHPPAVMVLSDLVTCVRSCPVTHLAWSHMSLLHMSTAALSVTGSGHPCPPLCCRSLWAVPGL